MTETSSPSYREVQRFRDVWWIMLVVYGIAGLMWWGFVEQIVIGRPWGSKPAPDWMMWALLITFGIGFPVIFRSVCLIVEVRPDELFVEYRPLRTRRVAYGEIVSVAARTYRPIRDYGGWGIKGWSAQHIAYNVRGNSGVLLTFRDGRTLMLGSQDAEGLLDAIEKQKHCSVGRSC